MKRLIYIAALFISALSSADALLAQTPTGPAASATTPTFDLMGPKLLVADLDRSIKFYTQDLGLTLSQRLSNTTAVLASSGKAPPPLIVLVQTPKPITVGNGLSAMMMSVSDPVALRARLTASGYTPTDEGFPGVYLVKDPDGYTVEVTSGRPPAKEK